MVDDFPFDRDFTDTRVVGNTIRTEGAFIRLAIGCVKNEYALDTRANLLVSSQLRADLLVALVPWPPHRPSPFPLPSSPVRSADLYLRAEPRR